MQVPHPAWGKAGLGVKGCPYFASRREMVSQLEHLTAHYVTLWQRRLQRPLHAAHFLTGFYPSLAGGGALLRPYQPAPRGTWCPPLVESGVGVRAAPAPSPEATSVGGTILLMLGCDTYCLHLPGAPTACISRAQPASDGRYGRTFNNLPAPGTSRTASMKAPHARGRGRPWTLGEEPHLGTGEAELVPLPSPALPAPQ